MDVWGGTSLREAPGSKGKGKNKCEKDKKRNTGLA